MSVMRKLSAVIAGVALVGGLGLAASTAPKKAPPQPRRPESQKSRVKSSIQIRAMAMSRTNDWSRSTARGSARTSSAG